jgi:hypothetical protein
LRPAIDKTILPDDSLQFHPLEENFSPDFDCVDFRTDVMFKRVPFHAEIFLGIAR